MQQMRNCRLGSLLAMNLIPLGCASDADPTTNDSDILEGPAISGNYTESFDGKTVATHEITGETWTTTGQDASVSKFAVLMVSNPERYPAPADPANPTTGCGGFAWSTLIPNSDRN